MWLSEYPSTVSLKVDCFFYQTSRAGTAAASDSVEMVRPARPARSADAGAKL